MRELKITGGSVLLDDTDFPSVSKLRWYVDARGYATSRTAGYMHHYVFGAVGLDHINGDKLDNRKANLRHATQQENLRNRAKTDSKTSSQYKGVSWHSTANRWRAYIVVDYKQIHLGLFDREEDAAMAYNTKAIQLFGDFAKLNVLDAEQAAERRMGA